MYYPMVFRNFSVGKESVVFGISRFFHSVQENDSFLFKDCHDGGGKLGYLEKQF